MKKVVLLLTFRKHVKHPKIQSNTWGYLKVQLAYFA